MVSLEEKVREILLKEWDPIGVYYYPGACDEYDSYIPIILQHIKNHDKKQFVHYLCYVEENLMLMDNHKCRDFYSRIFSKLEKSVRKVCEKSL